MNLRKLAQECPHCMACGLENPNRDLLCLAHSNALEDGRGYAHKSNDLYGAYLCDTCHKKVDSGMWSKQEKWEFHKAAWTKTMRWWINNGYVEAK